VIKSIIWGENMEHAAYDHSDISDLLDDPKKPQSISIA
jgi:hypothetical protein